MAYGDLKRLSTSTTTSPSAEATVYTAPTGKTSEVVMIWLHNTSVAAVDAEMWLPATVGADNNKRLAISIAANESFELSPKVPFVLNGDEQIRMKSSVGDVVSVLIIGREQI